MLLLLLLITRITRLLSGVIVHTGCWHSPALSEVGWLLLCRPTVVAAMGLNWADAGTLLRGTPGLSASIADTVTPLTLETSCYRTAHPNLY